MKYYIRRAIVGIISIPFIAGAYTFVFLTLIAIGGITDQNVTETYHNGILIGITAAIFITFYPQIEKLVSKDLD